MASVPAPPPLAPLDASLPGVPQRAVFPYSVVPGGVESVSELRKAIATDPVVADHYKGFKLSKARVERLGSPKVAYVSYRVGDHVYWTRKRLLLPAGERVITDGQLVARTRCANQLGDVPGAISPAEPDSAVLNGPTGSSPALIATSGLGLPLGAVAPSVNAGAGRPGPGTSPGLAGPVAGSVPPGAVTPGAVPTAPPVLPEVPDGSSGPGAPSDPTDPGGTPGIPGPPGPPNAPQGPSTPEGPSTPGSPGTPGVPGTPDNPGTPGVPGTPDNPGTPGPRRQPPPVITDPFVPVDPPVFTPPNDPDVPPLIPNPDPPGGPEPPLQPTPEAGVPVPEPGGSMMLMLIGLGGLVALRVRTRRRG
ncbi:MAG TPA: hypothetical protein VEL51_02385 [Vicinamibacterales bacterium]|nr:hypothetical protein [Vicinamibacterales bacterium]